MSNAIANKKIIFADFAVVKYSAIVDKLKLDGASTESMTDLQRFLDAVTQGSYDVAVVNLLLGGMGPFEMVANLRKFSKNQHIKLIVVSRQVHKINIQNTIRAGANDFVAEPFDNENLYNRILYHLSPKKEISTESYETKAALGTELVPTATPVPVAKKAPAVPAPVKPVPQLQKTVPISAPRPTPAPVPVAKKAPAAPVSQLPDYSSMNLLLDCVEMLSKTGRTQEHSTFLKVLQNVASFLGSNRTSLIIVEMENDTGVVLASSDDPNFYDFPIALSKYPEILHVIHTGSFVLVDDVSRNLMTESIREQVKTIQIGSIMVFPVRFQGEVMGVMTVRRPKASGLPSMEVLRVIQAVANTLAAHSNVKAVLRRLYKQHNLKIAV